MEHKSTEAILSVRIAHNAEQLSGTAWPPTLHYGLDSATWWARVVYRPPGSRNRFLKASGPTPIAALKELDQQITKLADRMLTS